MTNSPTERLRAFSGRIAENALTSWAVFDIYGGAPEARALFLSDLRSILDAAEERDRLRGALEAMVEAEVDYMIRNRLGDPEKQPRPHSQGD